MPITRTSSGSDWLAVLAGGLGGLSRGLGDVSEEDRLRKEQQAREQERADALAFQRQQLEETMQLKRDTAEQQATDAAGKQLDRGRATYGTDQDVPDSLRALASRAGRSDELQTRPVDPQLRAGVAATGASVLPTASTRFMPNAQEREQRDTRSTVDALARGMQQSNPEAAQALQIGNATGKYPTMGPEALRRPQSPAEKQQADIDAAITRENALRPGRLQDYEDRERIQAKYRPAAGSNLTPGQTTAASRLSDDYTRDSKPFADRALSFDTISTVSKDPSPAGDISLVFSFMKMVDPGSTVRESEQADARNAAGVPDQLRNMYNRVLTGQRLTPDQRADFVRRAGDIYKSAKGRQDRITAVYTDRAKRIGVDPAMVVMDYGAMAPVPSDAPPANPAAPPSAKAPVPVGATVTLKGKPHRITKLYPDGTFDAEPVP